MAAPIPLSNECTRCGSASVPCVCVSRQMFSRFYELPEGPELERLREDKLQAARAADKGLRRPSVPMHYARASASAD